MNEVPIKNRKRGLLTLQLELGSKFIISLYSFSVIALHYVHLTRSYGDTQPFEPMSTITHLFGPPKLTSSPPADTLIY